MLGNKKMEESDFDNIENFKENTLYCWKRIDLLTHFFFYKGLFSLFLRDHNKINIWLEVSKCSICDKDFKLKDEIVLRGKLGEVYLANSVLPDPDQTCFSVTHEGFCDKVRKLRGWSI